MADTVSALRASPWPTVAAVAGPAVRRRVGKGRRGMPSLAPLLVAVGSALLFAASQDLTRPPIVAGAGHASVFPNFVRVPHAPTLTPQPLVEPSEPRVQGGLEQASLFPIPAQRVMPILTAMENDQQGGEEKTGIIAARQGHDLRLDLASMAGKRWSSAKPTSGLCPWAGAAIRCSTPIGSEDRIAAALFGSSIPFERSRLPARVPPPPALKIRAAFWPAGPPGAASSAPTGGTEAASSASLAGGALPLADSPSMHQVARRDEKRRRDAQR
jgi:hypothetical protein